MVRSKSKEDQETSIDWSAADELAKVWTNDPKIIKILENIGCEEFPNGNTNDTHSYYLDVSRIHIRQGESRKGRSSNRPERTHEQKVTKLFQIRKGKMEKTSGKALGKKETRKLMAYCEERVTAKEQEV